MAFGALQNMADQINQQPTQIADMAITLKPVVNDLLAQNVHPDQIKATINDYYAANPEGVSTAGLQEALMTLAPKNPSPVADTASLVPVTPNPAPLAPPPEQIAPQPIQNGINVPLNPNVNGSAAPNAPVATVQPMASAPEITTHLDAILSQPVPSSDPNKLLQDFIKKGKEGIVEIPPANSDNSNQYQNIPNAQPSINYQKTEASVPVQNMPINSHLDAILSSPTPDETSVAPQNQPPVEAHPSDIGYRFAKGLQDPVVGLAQALVHVPSPFPQTEAQKEIDKKYETQIDTAVNQREDAYKNEHPVEGVDWANLAGNVISPANALLPLKAIAQIPAAGSALTRLAKGALSGGVMTAAQPTETDNNVGYAGAKAFQTGEGAAGGAAFSHVGNVAGKIIKPEISKDVQTLLDEGVRVSTDQMSGKGGSKLTSVPIVGDLIHESHNRAVQDLNTSVLNKALNYIGEKIPPNVSQFGNDALSHVRQRFSDAYETLLPTLKGNINDQTTNTLGQQLLTEGESVIGGDKPMSFHQKFSQMMQDKYHDMDLETANRLGNILDKRISKTINNDGSFTGQQFKNIESGLSSDALNYAQSNDPQHIMLKNALSDVKGLLRDQLSASNPEGQKALEDINKGYSIFKTAQRAAGSTAAPNGMFNPAQLYAAVKAGDKTLNKRAFTEGDLPLYDLASAAKNVLSDYKDSGTAARGMAAAAAGAVATGGIRTILSHPFGSLLGGATAGLYTEPGQAVARHLMTVRPKGAGALSDLVKQFTDTSTLSPYSK